MAVFVSQVVEYTGNGVHIHDVGLAQAKSPLTTRTHYFEIEILEPGQHCYIAIGLVHKVGSYSNRCSRKTIRQRSTSRVT